MKLSVIIPTYNHEKYIARCIEGVLAQRAPFDFEILIGEDASTDATRAICEAYAREHAGRIRLFKNDDPQDKIFIRGQPTGRKNLVELWKRSRGEYVAIVEGDDCWTDPDKLAIQIAFLDAHPDYVVCYHRVAVESDDGADDLGSQVRQKGDNAFCFADSLRGKHGATLSMVFRNREDLLPLFERTSLTNPVGDWPLECLLTLAGKGLFMTRTMGVYTRHAQGAIARLRPLGLYFDSRLQFLKALLDEAPLTPAQEACVRERLVKYTVAARNTELAREFDLRLFAAQLREYLANLSMFTSDAGDPYRLRNQFVNTLKIPLFRAWQHLRT